jgi:hypothetical protein
VRRRGVDGGTEDKSEHKERNSEVTLEIQLKPEYS